MLVVALQGSRIYPGLVDHRRHPPAGSSLARRLAHSAVEPAMIFPAVELAPSIVWIRLGAGEACYARAEGAAGLAGAHGGAPL
jgi:hypothetical protein